MAKPDPNLWEWTGSRYRYIGATNLGNRSHLVYVSPRMACTFEMDREGIARLAVGAELERAVHDVVAHRAMPYAISISPHGHTLDYVSSWEIRETFAVIAGMRRVACRLFNGSLHAAAVEWISRRGHGHGYQVLGRTLAYLNGTSPTGPAVRAAFNPGLHPRGAGGRFIPTTGTAALRRRAAAAARIHNNPGTGGNP